MIVSQNSDLSLLEIKIHDIQKETIQTYASSIMYTYNVHVCPSNMVHHTI